MTKQKTYRGNAYWQNEQPEYADAGRIRVAYYPKTGKLHFSVLFRNFEDAKIRVGKTIVIDEKQAKSNPEFVKLIKKVAGEWGND